ncbi:hypothetical protein pipiens_019595 [Culex pipiens pipiens]|uniref:Uncharacterized protein n=1 Tax=Culex pipiens pipiens TaxID=38569 RepID=A0ABD1DTW1_CULPP
MAVTRNYFGKLKLPTAAGTLLALQTTASTLWVAFAFSAVFAPELGQFMGMGIKIAIEGGMLLLVEWKPSSLEQWAELLILVQDMRELVMDLAVLLDVMLEDYAMTRRISCVAAVCELVRLGLFFKGLWSRRKTFCKKNSNEVNV